MAEQPSAGEGGIGALVEMARALPPSLSSRIGAAAVSLLAMQLLGGRCRVDA